VYVQRNLDYIVDCND